MRLKNVCQVLCAGILGLAYVSPTMAEDQVTPAAPAPKEAKAGEPTPAVRGTTNEPTPAAQAEGAKPAAVPQEKVIQGTVKPSGAIQERVIVNGVPSGPVIMNSYDAGGQLGHMLQLHNNMRARSGLSPMRMHPALNQAAQQFADYVARTRSFGHYADGRSPGDRMAAAGYRLTSWAENLAWSGSSADVAMNTWMNSGGHRANILSGHQEVGFGVSGDVWVACYGNSSGGGSYDAGYPIAGSSPVVNGAPVVAASPVTTQTSNGTRLSSIPLAPGERIISEKIISEKIITK